MISYPWLIVKIGYQVMDKALKQLKKWQGYPFFKDLMMSINISVKHFLICKVEEFNLDPSHKY